MYILNIANLGINYLRRVGLPEIQLRHIQSARREGRIGHDRQLDLLSPFGDTNDQRQSLPFGRERLFTLGVHLDFHRLCFQRGSILRQRNVQEQIMPRLLCLHRLVELHELGNVFKVAGNFVVSPDLNMILQVDGTFPEVRRTSWVWNPKAEPSRMPYLQRQPSGRIPC